FGVNSFGLSLVPFLFGIFFLFLDGRSWLGWLLTISGATIILAGVVANLSVRNAGYAGSVDRRVGTHHEVACPVLTSVILDTRRAGGPAGGVKCAMGSELEAKSGVR